MSQNIITALTSTCGQTAEVDNTIDNEIKIYIMLLQKFQNSELRAKVDDNVDNALINSAAELLTKLDKLTNVQKIQVRNQLKSMLDEVERQIMQNMLMNAANFPGASSLSDLLNPPQPEPTTDEANTSNINISGDAADLLNLLANALCKFDMSKLNQLFNK